MKFTDLSIHKWLTTKTIFASGTSSKIFDLGYLQVIFTFSFSILAIFITILAMHLLYQDPNPLTFTESKNLFIAREAWRLFPKPKENIIFIACIFALIPISILMGMVVRYFSSRIHFLSHSAGALKALQYIASFSGMLMLCIPFINSDFLKLTCIHLYSISGIVLIFIFFILIIFIDFIPRTSRRNSKFFRLFCFISCILLTLPTYIPKLMNVSTPAFEFHSDGVLYPIVQVFGGKTLLADLIPMYGLYAEILNPLFHLIGLSVFKFSLVMTALLLLGFIALFKALTMIVRRVSFWFLFCFSFTLFMSVLIFSYEDWTPYFQYYPIRFLFPAIGTFLVVTILKSEEHSSSHVNKLIVFTGIVSATGVFWNFDSGIPLTGGLFGWLFMRLIVKNQKLVQYSDLKKIVLLTVSFLLTISCLLIYLILKAQDPVTFSDYFKYQKLYYIMGYNAFPLPKAFHPWTIFLGIYGFGIVSSLYLQCSRLKSTTSEIVFFLSLMGIGLFAYYQGRAQEYNLTNVIWPALFIVLVLADRTIRSTKKGLVPRCALFPAATAVLLTVIFSTSYVIKIPYLIKLSKDRYKQLTSKEITTSQENIKFIATHLGKSKSAVIISQKQSAYLAELGLVSPIKGPGVSETILKSDVDSFLRQISEKRISKIFICLADGDKIHDIYMDYLPLSTKYKIAASIRAHQHNSDSWLWDRNMSMLVPYQQPVENILLK